MHLATVIVRGRASEFVIRDTISGYLVIIWKSFLHDSDFSVVRCLSRDDPRLILSLISREVIYRIYGLDLN